MEKVDLFTRSSSGLEKVITVVTPPFSPKPVVIMWGERFFVWANSDQCYIEEFVYAAILTEEDL